MGRKLALVVCVVLALTMVPATGGTTAGAAPSPTFTPGAPGAGDPYFPKDGNGGYDVQSYDLTLSYDPATDRLAGTARIRAKATQNLSAFNLDFVRLTVHSIEVDTHAATWVRNEGEMTVTPDRGLRKGRYFTVVVDYAGVPGPIEDLLGESGFMATDDGAMVAGQPQVAATWFPANDHPSDKARFSFEITVPKGLEVIANGRLEGTADHGDQTTWTWKARDPMATYLATIDIGEFDVRSYRADGIHFWDALDPDLFFRPEPRTGSQFAVSQVGQPSFKRLTRTISVPAGGADLSFFVTRDTEPGWDHFFVEAHHPGQDDWTTLPDANGHTNDSTGSVCPYWLDLHPFLTHYQTDVGGFCDPTGTSGSWNAVSGHSDGYEEWSIDLSPYAGGDVEVSLSYASDDLVQLKGVFIDDVTVSTGEGSTSFEPDADPLDGWTVPGAPEGSLANPNDWIAGTKDDVPPSTGEIAEGSLARQDEILSYLSSVFGRYPWPESGGIIDDTQPAGFALETQTRPVYAKAFFTDPISGDSVIVHELTHQWFGDSLAVKDWSNIWLNEGFATYAEWLWGEHDNVATVQDTFDAYYNGIPADDPFWSVKIGDPGPALVFDNAIYYRGAMALHQLRLTVGDDAFFSIMRRWATSRAGDNVTIGEFIALAERVSGQDLGDLFDTWLFTTGKPDAIPAPDAAPTATARTASPIPPPMPAPLRRPFTVR